MKQECQTQIKKYCPDCSSQQLEKDNVHGEVFCQECGLVLDENLIDFGPEWRAFDAEQKEQRARTGAPMNELIYDKGLSTTIGWKNKDYYGHKIPKRNQSQMYRIRKWHYRTKIRRGREYSLNKGIQHIIRVSSILGLPITVRENAAVIFRKASRNYLIHGRSIEGVAAASIYAGCRQCNLHRTLDELSKASGLTKKEIGRTYRFLSRKLSLKLLPARPQDFLNRYSNKLKLSSETKQTAKELIENGFQDKTLTGCSPSSIAAAALYIAAILCHEKKTQHEVAEAAHVTEVTIRNRYKELCKQLDIHIAI